jgi:tetratricopeptide (TPR) repeat protein
VLKVGFFGGLLVGALWAPPVAADLQLVDSSDAVDVAERYFRLGVFDEEDREFEDALAAQRECMAVAPYSAWARSARQRVAWMSARSEGGFEPLARLERVRRNPTLGADPDALEALAREADAFPPGRVRAEARMFVGEAWLARPTRLEDAIRLFRQVADDPSSDSTDTVLARRSLVETLFAVGRVDEAARRLEASPAASTPELSARIHRERWLRILWQAVAAGLVLCMLLTVRPSLLRWPRRRALH